MTSSANSRGVHHPILSLDERSFIFLFMTYVKILPCFCLWRHVWFTDSDVLTFTSSQLSCMSTWLSICRLISCFRIKWIRKWVSKILGSNAEMLLHIFLGYAICIANVETASKCSVRSTFLASKVCDSDDIILPFVVRSLHWFTNCNYHKK